MEITNNHVKGHCVGVLGGFIGQLIVVVSATHKHSKESLLDPKLIQNFLLLYIDARMRTERFTLMVGSAVEQFLASLDKPLKLNEMRVMKDSNYTKFRQILSDSTLFGDEILALLKDQCSVLGISSEAFDVVYEGFWDLYCKKPFSLIDIPVKKLEGFLSRVKLIPPHSGYDEDGNAVQSPAKLPLRAIVRVRIPLVRPPPPIDTSQMVDNEEEEEEDGGRQTSRTNKTGTARSQPPTSHREHL